MWTSDDMLFCVLHNCSNSLLTSKLNYCFYLYQILGFNYNLRYKLTASGLDCREVNDYIDLLLSMDMISIDSGVVRITEHGKNYYESVPLFVSEWNRVDTIKSILERLSVEEIHFIVLTDILISDVRNKGGVEALVKEKDSIKKSLASLSSEYSEDNFNTSVNIIRFIKGDLDSI